MIQPGLERIALLLNNVSLPWKAIHVAGTNGKGSVCSYASALLWRRNIRCGQFTSPHLVHRWDCIAINNRPVSKDVFQKAEEQVLRLNEREKINASEFEILTATAFHIFNDQKVDVGVVEVGMGGKLDATNILNNQAVSIICKIAHDHQNFLGDSIEEIARHKAGILRPNVPYVVNPLNEWNVHNVIDGYAQEIGAGPRIVSNTPELRDELFSQNSCHKSATPLRPFQQDNIVLAYLAVVETLKNLGLRETGVKKYLSGLEKGVLPGRFQHHRISSSFQGLPSDIHIDGAHNPDAAIALDEFIQYNVRGKGRIGRRPPEAKAPCESSGPVIWVLAMTDGKDARQYLSIILKPGDSVVTTAFGPVDGMPWVKPMDPEVLLKTALDVQPGVTGISIPTRGVFRALCAAQYISENEEPVVLTGSLYLVGDFLREKERWTAQENNWLDEKRQKQTENGKWIDMELIDQQERDRVNSLRKSI